MSGALCKNMPPKRGEKFRLLFSHSRIRKSLKAKLVGRMIPAATGVFLAAIIEYLIAEVLELAGNAAKTNKKVRITPRFLMLAIRNDPELDAIVHRDAISEGGIIPHIHPQLLLPPKTTPKKPAKSASHRKGAKRVVEVSIPCRPGRAKVEKGPKRVSDLWPKVSPQLESQEV